MKKAIVLAGGGAKGAYEAGFMKAVLEVGKDYQIVTGTSIGALNACLLAQKDIDVLLHLWQTIDSEDVFAGGLPKLSLNLEEMLDQSHLVLSFFKKYIQEKGADITPLKKLIRQCLDEEKLLSSPIDFGLCTVMYPSLQPVMITKQEMGQDIFDYLIASASCFPLFPIHTFHQQGYIDGGYYDNLPIDLALDMGAEEVLVVDMSQKATHPHYLHRPYIFYTQPYASLNGFMDFSREAMDRQLRLGYQTAMKYLGKYVGVRYTFLPFQTSLFQDVYRQSLYLERRVRSLTHHEAKSHLIDKLMQAHHDEPLSEKDYLYILLDWLADLCQRDDSYVYQFDLFVRDILQDFSDYMQEDFQISLFRLNKEISSLKALPQKTLMGLLIHAMMYPQKESLDIEKIMPFFLKEIMMAKLIIMFQYR